MSDAAPDAAPPPGPAFEVVRPVPPFADPLTPARRARAAALIRGGGVAPGAIDGMRQVRLTVGGIAALLYADDDGNFVLGEDGRELVVPIPAGTICEVADVDWIGGSQGVGFHLVPQGAAFPDAAPLQIDEADLDGGFYPFEPVAAGEG